MTIYINFPQPNVNHPKNVPTVEPRVSHKIPVLCGKNQRDAQNGKTFYFLHSKKVGTLYNNLR